jgi:hypothetical protein
MPRGRRQKAHNRQCVAAPRGPNHRSILCRIPVAILIRILKFVQLAPDGHSRAKNESAYYSWNAPRNGWTRMLQVCKHVYEVAVQTPELWSTIDCAWSTSRISHLRKRSGDTPLTLRAPISTRNPSVHRVLSESIHHAHAAFITLQADSSINPINPLLNSRLPKLRCLEYSDRLRSFAVTRQFLGGVAASLSKLVLNQVKIVDAPEFPTLQSLTISRTTMDPHFIGLRRLLGQARGLQELHIDFVQRAPAVEFQHRGRPPTTKIVLPFLRLLRIEDELQSMVEALRILPDPSLQFIVDLSSASTRSRLDQASQPLHVQLLTRLRTFWRRVTGEQQLPEGVVTMRCPTLHPDVYRFGGGIIEDTATNTVAFGWGPYSDRLGPTVYYRSTCILPGPHHRIFDDVRTLRVIDIRQSLSQHHQLPLYLSAFPKLEHVVIEDVTRRKDAQDVLDWEREQKERGKPFKSVTFLNRRIDTHAYEEMVERMDRECLHIPDNHR